MSEKRRMVATLRVSVSVAKSMDARRGPGRARVAAWADGIVRKRDGFAVDDADVDDDGVAGDWAE